jgi:hypothetical protein
LRDLRIEFAAGDYDVGVALLPEQAKKSLVPGRSSFRFCRCGEALLSKRRGACRAEG